jgi:cell division protease FtsH
VTITARPEEGTSIWLVLLYQSLPFLLFSASPFSCCARCRRTRAGGAMGFGKSKAKLLTQKEGKVTFADVAGIDEAREELQEIVEFLKDPASSPARRQDPQGRAAGRFARHRQDPARPRHRG